MPRVEYTQWAPHGETLTIVGQANTIISEFRAQGFSLTLRQLYYQFVARGLIPNTDRSYKNLGNTINKARMAGLIDWTSIEDRTRSLAALAHWDSEGDILNSAAEGFHQDLWADQPVRVEVWVEKEALAGVVARPANLWDCAYFCCRGYVSQSEQWRAARRVHRYITGGQRVVILHLGDHDPSGIDMTRDIRERILHFICVDEADYPPEPGEIADGAESGWYDDYLTDMREAYIPKPPDDEDDALGRWAYADVFEVRRIGLNFEQVTEYQPPPNPTKLTDSRAGDYIARFGMQSWELDALSPTVIAGLIEAEILAEIDIDRFTVAQSRVESVKDGLRLLAATPWADVDAWVRGV